MQLFDHVAPKSEGLAHFGRHRGAAARLLVEQIQRILEVFERLVRLVQGAEPVEDFFDLVR